MRYIRTGKNHWEGIYEVIGEQELYYLVEDEDWKDGSLIPKCNVVKQADNIEELCDCYSYDIETTRDYLVAKSWKLHRLEREVYGCIKTNKGLIYVAKMNENGEFELL